MFLKKKDQTNCKEGPKKLKQATTHTPRDVTLVRLPSPILITQILPPKLLTSQLVRHETAFLLLVQRIRPIIKHPLPGKQITPRTRLLATIPTRRHRRRPPVFGPPSTLITTHINSSNNQCSHQDTHKGMKAAPHTPY